MACATCGQNAQATSTRSTPMVSAGSAGCGYNCPTLSNPPKCDELKNLVADINDELSVNREFVNGCSGASILNYVDSIVERQQCIINQLVIALCAKQDK